ncbi:hypothetical protein KUTeg_014705 [Tegillarca granosa]|uniref:Ig-like domain-containing protein n=1 Tax=Tegillarca granosa TaxID=220873 RepID=A0ABQ9ERB2_TEGGR|nr:hypothetical protein KUTeg_014705 [Tegillarca granosa]
MVTLFLGCVSAETVCLHDDVVIRWDLQQYKDIAYAYLQHEGELIVSIGSPNFFIIDEKFNNKVNLNVTKTWLIAMTVYNINSRDNGTYTCTVGSIGKREITIKRYLTIRDPGDDINLYITEDDQCRTVNCVSNYNVTIRLAERIVVNRASKYYRIWWDIVGNKETTTRFTSMNVKMYQQSTGGIIGCVVGVIVLLVVVLIVVIVIKLRKKDSCKLKETIKDKEQEECCLQNQTDLKVSIT